MTYAFIPNRQCRSCGATGPERLCHRCIARLELKADVCCTCGAACPEAPNMETDPRCDDCLNHAGLPINGFELDIR